MKDKLKALFTDYRFYICIFITIAFGLIGYFVFERSYLRLYESFIDFGTGIAYYFQSFFMGEPSISATVTLVPDNFWEFNFLSLDMSMFAPKFYSWWYSLWNLETISNFGSSLLRGFLLFVQVLMVLLLVCLLVWFLIKRYFKPSGKAPGSDSKPLILHRKMSKFVYTPVKNWILSFFTYLKNHKWILYFWLFIWCLNFDFVVIIIEFFAFYFYFLGSFDFVSLFIQFYKLIGDLVPLVTFVPSYFAAAIIIVVLFNRRRTKRGLNKLRHYEAIDKGVVNSLGVSNLIVGPIGVGKTSTMTDMALSCTQNFRYQAFKSLLEEDMKYPLFPWIKFEQALNHQIDSGYIVNLASISKWVSHLKYLYIVKGRHHLFGYDFDKNPITFYNGLVEEDIFTSLETYAKLYFIYSVSSSMIVSNYSIREDICTNFSYDTFPSWDFDFFSKDGRYAASYSRHSHILDQDSMRFGKLVDPSNPRRYALEFGVVCESEIDKERGNKNTTASAKVDDVLANQKNDDFNNWLKLARHNATVANFCYFKFLGDLQRVPSLNADLVETCQCIVNISSQSETLLSLPISKPFMALYRFAINRLESWYTRMRYVRSDNTLFSYLVHLSYSKIINHYNYLVNTFGYYQLDLSIDSGVNVSTGKENSSSCHYYLMFKKYRSNRYSTNCFSEFYQVRDVDSLYGIYNLPEYSSTTASFSELKDQHSYMVDSIFDKFDIDDSGSDDNGSRP